jgi:hypothetical protein
MLVPDRGDPTTKIELLGLRRTWPPFHQLPSLVAKSSQSTVGFRRIQKLPPAGQGKLGNVALISCLW